MYWRVACSTPGHCLNLYWFTVKLEHREQITVILEFKEMHLKMSSAKFRPFYSGLNVMILKLVAWWPATSRLRIRKPLMSYKNRATNHRRHCETHILGIEIIEFRYSSQFIVFIIIIILITFIFIYLFIHFIFNWRAVFSIKNLTSWNKILWTDSIKRCHLTSIGNPIVEIILSVHSDFLYWCNDMYILNRALGIILWGLINEN